MRILITGSGAADGVPGFFADSNVSRYARKNGGKDVRTRSGALIDGVLKIDFGPDTFAQCQALGLDPCEWKYIVYTHSHDDHYSPKELQYAFPPFVGEHYVTPRVYGNQVILSGIESAFAEGVKLDRILIQSFCSVEIGEYKVTPIRAYHKLDEDSLNLIIQRNGKSFLYAADTGVYQEQTWKFLEGWKFDGAVIECTDGFNPRDYWGHLSCAELIDLVGRLRGMGCFGDKTVICTTHHSHTGLATHAELEACLNPHGIHIGFDGKLFEI